MELNPLNKENARILIVEDDLVHLFIAQTCLRDHFNIDTAMNGHAALEAMEKKAYDVVLMDINLNDHTLDGTQTMRKIKFNRKYRLSKVIAVTASSDAKEWYLKQGFDGHYMKPIVEKTIVEEINNQLTKNLRIIKTCNI
jgi:two-component system, sensor histidine kinase and response regulator